MTALESLLLEQLRKLPPNRVAEVVDFAAFLAAREEREAAVQRLRQDMASMDALGLPPVTDDEIEEAVQESRRERRRQNEEAPSGEADAAASPRQRP